MRQWGDIRTHLSAMPPIRFVLLASALLASMPLAGAAQSRANLVPPVGAEDDKGWSGKGELGVVVSKGNTESESFVGKLDLDYSDARRKFAFGAWGQYSSSEGIESARRHGTYATAGIRRDPRSYYYGSLRGERDSYGTYEYQWTAAAGYGHELLADDSQRLFVEAGPGYRFAKDQGVQLHHNEAIARALLDWRWKLSATATLSNSFLLEAGSDNTFARNLFGLQVAMGKGLAMKAGLETRYNSRVDAGVATTDQLTTVNLVYNFK